jgi:hypothetical protein
MRKGEYKSTKSVDVAPGWQASAELTKNGAGDWVISKVTLEAISDKAAAEGLTANVLRSIKLSDLVESVISDDDQNNFWLHATHPDYEQIRKKWLSEISGEMQKVGPNNRSKIPYAKIAFFYVLEVRENPKSPLQSLAKKLDVDKSTVARRIDTARKLGLLHRPISEQGPAGKAGGFLTKEAYEVLGFTEEGN